jgi:hypothetical protein
MIAKTVPQKTAEENKLRMLQLKVEFKKLGFKSGMPKLLFRIFPERFQSVNAFRLATQVCYLRAIDEEIIDAYEDLINHLKEGHV